jgi:hypothetical protein
MRLIYLLGLKTHFDERPRLATMEQFGPDMDGKSAKEAITECRFIPVHTRGEFVEVNDIFCDSLVILHGKIAESSFGVPTEIVRSKMICKLPNKSIVVVKPIWNITDVTH